jgi:hypothetical protein
MLIAIYFLVNLCIATIVLSGDDKQGGSSFTEAFTAFVVSIAVGLPLLLIFMMSMLHQSVVDWYYDHA